MIPPFLQMAEAEPRLLGTETPIFKVYYYTHRFPKPFSVFEMTDNHFSKVHHTLLNVMVFIILFYFNCLQAFVQFLNLIVTYSYAHSPLLSPSENREIHFILFIFYSNFFVPALPYS